MSANTVNGISVSMKSTQSFSVTAFEGGPTPKPAGGEPAATSSSTNTISNTSGSQASSPSIDVKRLAGELKAISAEMGNKPTCGCSGKSAAPPAGGATPPTSGASPAPTSGATPPTSGAPGGTPPPGGADKAGQPGGAAQGKQSFQQLVQSLMQALQKMMQSFGMQGA